MHQHLEPGKYMHPHHRVKRKIKGFTTPCGIPKKVAILEGVAWSSEVWPWKTARPA